MRWQILCDFDGTISVEDTLDGILEGFGAPEWRDIDRAMTEGEFGSQVARSRQTSLLHAGQEEVERYLQTVTIDSGFHAFLSETMKAGLPLTVVSDGYDVAVKQVLALNGIENLDVLANRLLFNNDRHCEIEFPFMDSDCAVEAAVCKCSAMGRLRNRKSVLIGNGYSDFCTAGAADFVFAKDDLIDYCRSEDIPHVSFARFEELTPLVPLIAGDGAALFALAGRPPLNQ